jgi:hypothetical protein
MNNKNKQKNLIAFKNMIIQRTIRNRDDLIDFLVKEANSYATFILERINRNPDTLKVSPTHKHHIIPKHAGGSDEPFNLIRLTIEEHAKAHELLYENYGKLADLAASHMISGRIDKGDEAIRKMIQEKMKKEGKGFYSSAVQKELATRPRKRRIAYTKSPYIATALLRGFTLYNAKTGETVCIEPLECPNLVFVIDKVMQVPSMKAKREKWNCNDKKSNYSTVTGLTRILTGNVQQKTGKSLYSTGGWTVKGINLDID